MKETKAGSHRATARGYAGGNIIEAGQLVPADVAVSDEWMEPVKGKDTAAAKAIEDVQKDRKDDADLTTLSKAALEALAVERGVTSVKGLSKDDLIAAIQASDEQRRL
jgi:hypothetical protein